MPALPALPSGIVTFLFTDIEGSTRCWEQHPAAMHTALARHDAILHAGITAQGGVVVTERGEGDSFFAVFSHPSAAVAAACALQTTLVAEPWPPEVAPLRVRMALHSGEAALWEGRDYRGAAVNRCARLRAAAHGGQIVLSAVTHALVADQLPPAVTLRDLGEHRLKDLTRTEHIFQVLHPALPADFPPLTTLDQERHTLPVQPTALIGRDREAQLLQERLLAPHARLLTLTGPGGVGKTRLALQVAAEVLDAFPDGVVFVNLAPLTDPALVLPTIAQTLGVSEASGHGEPLRDTLHRILRVKEVLLLLDNVEHVREAAVIVAELLAACARVRVLATSRAALQLRGERLYDVPPLALPPTAPLPPVQVLTGYDAVRLFVARAQDVRPDFALTAANASSVVEICARLDGLPLAIELAAARLRLLPPSALLSGLTHRLDLVSGGARDLPARQRTLRATIDWSYSLLTAAEQTLFARLSVFVGGGTLEALAAVCTPAGELDVLAGVEALVAQSLLHQTPSAAEVRFVMLETLHAYARERLEERGETDALRQAHATYFLRMAEDAEPHLSAPDQAAWLAHVDAEHDNLRAALDWAHARDAAGPPRPAGPAPLPWLELRLATALWRFWYTRGYLVEGRMRLEAALTSAVASGAPPALRARALYAASALVYRQGDLGRAAALAEESLALARAEGTRHGIADALNMRGNIAADQGDTAHAAACYAESLTLRRALDDTKGIIGTLINLGELARVQGDTAAAAGLFEESVAMARAEGYGRLQAIAANNLGLTAHAQGAFAQAEDLYRDSLALFESVGDRWYIAATLNNMAEVAQARGDRARAAHLYERSAALFDEIGDPGTAATVRAEHAHSAPGPAAPPS